MHLEFYLRRAGWPIEPVTEQSMFAHAGDYTILLVENHAEEELMEAFQFIYGAELNIQIWDRDNTIDFYLKHFSRVYTSWDPRDRNRI